MSASSPYLSPIILPGTKRNRGGLAVSVDRNVRDFEFVLDIQARLLRISIEVFSRHLHRLGELTFGIVISGLMVSPSLYADPMRLVHLA